MHTTRQRFGSLLAAAVLTLGLGAVHADDAPTSTGASSVSDNLKAAGNEVERESKVVAGAVKDSAVKVGEASKKVAHEVADASVKGAQDVKNAAQHVAAKTKSAVKGDSSGRDAKPEP
jgi:hypothetical protein